MKVCTEACLFGAWLAEALSDTPVSNALDIGAGTGLLSLMLAQTRNLQQLDAIEVDPAAAGQARENVLASPWPNSIRVIHADALQYNFQQRYQVIFSNPPFFEQSLRSPDPGKSLAKHEGLLDLPALLQLVQGLLKPTGGFAILLPFERAGNMIQLAAGRTLFLRRRADLFQTERHSAFRSLLLFEQGIEGVPVQENIIIKEDGNYSDRFRQLLSSYYLYL